MQLSIGMKYLFPSKLNSNLMKDAWQDFEERICWRLFFAFGNNSPEKELFDPDYEVSHKRKKNPPRMPGYIELGLLQSRVFVFESLHKGVKEVETPFKSLILSPRLISQFLEDNELVVTSTDKNLGIAVSKRTWIEMKSLELLCDTNNYREIHYLTMMQEVNCKCTKAELIATKAESSVPNGKQIGEFLRHLVTENGKPHILPKFYGILKIHKKPVKMRPIIPCHSAVQNPAAKYVDKNLRPLILEAPTIIHGTKDLAIKLSKLNINTNPKYFIITGDVVAFYPNIPITEYMTIILHMYEEFIGTIGINPATISTLKERRKFSLILLFAECLHLGNTKLICTYMGKYYLQLKGLAMGVASSPSIANLYGWFYEGQCGILNDPNIIFYGHYIDDCIAIVYADNEDQALLAVQKLNRTVYY